MCSEGSKRHLEGSGNMMELQGLMSTRENSQIRPGFLTRSEILRCFLICVQPFLNPVLHLFWAETSLSAVE